MITYFISFIEHVAAGNSRSHRVPFGELSNIYYSVGQMEGTQKRFIPGRYASVWMGGSHLRVNDCTLDILREFTLPLIKSTARSNTEEKMVMEK